MLPGSVSLERATPPIFSFQGYAILFLYFLFPFFPDCSARGKSYFFYAGVFIFLACMCGSIFLAFLFSLQPALCLGLQLEHLVTD